MLFDILKAACPKLQRLPQLIQEQFSRKAENGVFRDQPAILFCMISFVFLHAVFPLNW
jgi:hypothetical protein